MENMSGEFWRYFPSCIKMMKAHSNNSVHHNCRIEKWYKGLLSCFKTFFIKNIFQFVEYNLLSYNDIGRTKLRKLIYSCRSMAT